MQPLSRFYDGEAKSFTKPESALSVERYSYQHSRTLIMGFLALFAAVFVLSTRALFSGTYSWSNSLGHAIPGRFQPQTSWAQYSPFFPVKIYEGPPRHCKVIQANILQRHGARFPTSGASVGIRNAVSKLLTAANYTDPRVVFLRTYRYELGEDDLVAFGAHECVYCCDLCQRCLRELGPSKREECTIIDILI